MGGLALSKKQAWRVLKSEGSSNVTYQTVCNWLVKVGNQQGRKIEVVDEMALCGLRQIAKIREMSSAKDDSPSVAAKLAVLSFIEAMPDSVLITGTELFQLCDEYGALSPSALSARGARRRDSQGRKVTYTKREARDLVTICPKKFRKRRAA